MARQSRAACAVLALSAGLLAGCSEPGIVNAPDYPEARREARITVYHEVQVSDPYRWLESPDSAETRDWLRVQQRLVRARLRGLDDDADINGDFTRQLVVLRSLVLAGVPQLENGRYVYRRQAGMDGQAEIWLTLDPEGAGRPLITARDLPDATQLGDFVLSPDGTLLAWSFRAAGEPAWQWRIRDTQTAADSGAELAATGGVSWGADSRGLFYARESASPRDGSTVPVGIWYHRAGTGQGRDVQVHAGNVRPGLGVSPRVTDDGRYLLIELTDDTGYMAVHYQRLGRTPARGRVIRLIDAWDGAYRLAGSTERTFYFLTTADAPRGRVVAVDLDRPDPGDWRIVIPEVEWPLEEALIVGGRLALAYREPTPSRLMIHDLAGQPVREVELPGAGFAGLLSGHYADTGLLYAWTDLQRPLRPWRHDVNRGEGGPLALSSSVPDSVGDLRIDHLDGVSGGSRLALVRRAAADPAATGALLVTVGAGKTGPLPVWQPEAVAWATAGGTWAAFDPAEDTTQAVVDLLAAVDWLVAGGLAQSGQLAIEASGRGGVIAAAAINRRPELFAAALLRDAPLDLLRADLVAEGYGDPADADAFQRIFSLSPYHQLQDGQCHPAMIVSASEKSGTAPGWQAWKYLAALQATQDCESPVLLDTTGTGVDAWRFLAFHGGLRARADAD